MLQPKVSKWLRTTGKDACHEAVKWLAESGVVDMADAWEKCPRPDWMLWALRIIGYNNNQKLRLFSCACVRDVWDQLSDRGKQLIETAEAFANGNATKEDLAICAREAKYVAIQNLNGIAIWKAIRATTQPIAWDAAWGIFYATGSTILEETQPDHLRRIIGNPFKK